MPNLKKYIMFLFILIYLLIFISLTFATQTYLNESQRWEQNLTKIYMSSLVWGDLNNDNYPDLIVTGVGGINYYISKVYINNGTNLIENSTWEQNLTAVSYGSIALGDIDNDGDLDLALSGCEGQAQYVEGCLEGSRIVTLIYINNGTTLTESSQWQNNLTGVYRSALTFGDVDNDGDLDLILTGQAESTYISRIYLNNGTTLTESSQWQINLTAVRQSGLALGDLDNDGDLDLILSGRDLSSNKKSIAYINNGTSFIESSQWGTNLVNVDDSSVTLSDFDNDGDLDLSLAGCCDIQRIYRNNGSAFIEIDRENIGTIDGFFAGSSTFGDYDSDGYLDLITSGREDGTFLYLYNISTNNFTKYSQDPESHIINLHYSSLAWLDLDNDADLDLIETGYDGLDIRAYVYMSNFSLTKNNTLPTPPTTFSSDYDDEILNLTWGSGGDSETPTPGLYYNLMVGNSTHNNTIVSGVYGGSSNPTAGYFGNMMQRKSIELDLNLDNGTYYWYVQTIDTGLAKSSWSTRQSFTVSGGSSDTTSPTISSVSSSSITSSTATITWTTNESANSSVYYGTTTATTSSSVSSGLTGSHSISLSGLSASTLYYYNVSSCDSSNNCNTSSQYNFTTSASGSEDNGNNNPGGSTPPKTVVWTKTYSVGDEDFTGGYNKELSAKNRLQISVNNETHYVGVSEITNSTVTINVSSTPQIAILSMGDIRRFEVNGDNYYDINVTLNSINMTSNKANITILSIHEEVTAQTIAEDQSKEETAQEKKKEDIKSEKKLWFYLIAGVIIILISIVSIVLIKNIKRGKKK